MSSIKVTPKQTGFSSSGTTPTSSTSKRDRIGISPARITRLQEKEELQSLNDRLAAYIDKVRHVEYENDRLLIQIHSSEDIVKKEIRDIKNIYEHELSETRKLLDEVANEKAKMQIEAGKYRSVADDVLSKLSRKERELREAEKLIANLEGELNDLRGKYNQLLNENKKFEEENKQICVDNLGLVNQLEVAKKQLEDETLMRVDLENRLQSLQEDLEFKKSIHDKEISEIRTRRELAIREIDDKLQEEYQYKLEDALKDMRSLNDSQIQRAREEVEDLYQSKLAELHSAAERYTDANGALREDVYRARSELEESQGKIRALESQVLSTGSRMADLEKALQREKADHERSVGAREDEIRRLRETLSDYLLEYQELMDIKLALDMELVAYRKMLEGEEDRLKSSPRAQKSDGRSATPSSSAKLATKTTPATNPRKRKRLAPESNVDQGAPSYDATRGSSGHIEIAESDPAGASIKLTNTSDKDIALGGWTITRTVDDRDAVTHKLGRQCNLKGGESVSVWSSDAAQAGHHQSPGHVIMKNRSWPVGDSYATKVRNKEGQPKFNLPWNDFKGGSLAPSHPNNRLGRQKSHAHHTAGSAGRPPGYSEIDNGQDVASTNGQVPHDQDKCRLM